MYSAYTQQQHLVVSPYPRSPLLLEVNTSISDEMVRHEQAMTRHGLVLSVFVQFPGLVASKRVFDQVPKQGSLVLIRAAGNEPTGITDCIKLIQQYGVTVKTRLGCFAKRSRVARINTAQGIAHKIRA